MRAISCVVLALFAWISLPAPLATAVTIIVDNNNAFNDPGDTFSSTGTWTSSTSTSGGLYYGSSFLTHTGNQGPATATWQPTIPTADYYEVFVRHTQGATRTTAAAFTVNYDGGSFNASVDQTVNGGQWISIGIFPFAAGTLGDVQLTAATGSLTVTVADAVQFTTVPEPSSLCLLVATGAAALALRRRSRGRVQSR